MDRDALVKSLNWFYSLELNQVQLYTSQSVAFKGTYPSVILERVAEIEQRHVYDIEAVIKRLGYTPTVLGDVISPIIGSAAGKVLSMTGLSNTLRINILLEQKAMSDYSELIKRVRAEGLDNFKELKDIRTSTGTKSLLKILRFNYIDEDLHTAWFALHK